MSNNYHVVLIYYTNNCGVKTRKLFRVHTLVARAFIPNPKNKKEIHHKDTDPLNNHVDNLMWVTNEEHTKIHENLGKFKRSARRGESSNFAKTTDSVVKEICDEIIKNKLTPPQIAKKYNTSNKTIRLILHKKRWTHISKNMDFSNYNKLRQVDKDAKAKAIDMLKNTDLTLKDISQKTSISYTYVSHLNRKLNIREKK